MYILSDDQIDFILRDIKLRGIEMESLQNDLLDHVCCIIENRLEENGDFTQFYHSIIRTFYKNDLREIELETITLLTNKNYYVMKKVMIYSGIVAATTLTAGIILKFLTMPGAAFGIFTGIFLLSFVFLPLMFLLKLKRKTQYQRKNYLWSRNNCSNHHVDGNFIQAHALSGCKYSGAYFNTYSDFYLPTTLFHERNQKS